MARFSGKIHSVKFVDTAEKTIEVLHGEDSKKVFSYILPLDYTNQDFLDLLEEVSIEEIQDQTQQHYQYLQNAKAMVIQQAAQTMFDEWIKNAQADLDKQDEKRYKIFEDYKKKQVDIMYAEADEYKTQQFKILQSEINEQAETRYKEVEGMKSELLDKFQSTTNSVKYTPEKVAKYMIDNFEDEDTVFKTKLEIFNLPEVKNSKDREMKMKVRKAKTVPEIFAAYYDIQCNHS
jgi:hypothetical protein